MHKDDAEWTSPYYYCMRVTLRYFAIVFGQLEDVLRLARKADERARVSTGKRSLLCVRLPMDKRTGDKLMKTFWNLVFNS